MRACGRRGGLRRNTGVSRSVDEQFRSLFTSGSVWLDADSVTTSGANLSTVVDRMDAAHSLSVGAGTLAAPAAHADYGGKACLSFTGTQHIVSNRAASAWNFLHNGTGVTLIHVLTPTSAGTCLISATRTNTAVGHHAYWSSARTFWSITDAATTQIVNLNVDAQFVSGTPTVYCGTWQDGVSPEATLRTKSVTVQTGSSSGPPTPNNADGTLTIGAQVSGITKASMRWRATYILPYVVTAAQYTWMLNYIKADTGIQP